MEFAARRRVRVNGTLIQAGQRRLVIKVEQAYGNCPQYIQQRVLIPEHLDPAGGGDVRYGRALASEDIELIRGADTFFLGTTHPERGSDASHRGGQPGFVRVDGDQLWWPDYAGNNMFNSFGNLAIDPEAALLFLDFISGRTLQLTGAAAIEWGEPGGPGDDGHTGRRVRFTLQRLVAGQLLAARQTAFLSDGRPPDQGGHSGSGSRNPLAERVPAGRSPARKCGPSADQEARTPAAAARTAGPCINSAGPWASAGSSPNWAAEPGADSAWAASSHDRLTIVPSASSLRGPPAQPRAVPGSRWRCVTASGEAAAASMATRPPAPWPTRTDGTATTSCRSRIRSTAKSLTR